MRVLICMIVVLVASLATATTYEVGEPSEARYRVRERFGGVPFPSDTSGVTRALSGQVEVVADGTFVSGSVIRVDLATLQSNQPLRDAHVRDVVFDVERFPRAVFHPTRVLGVVFPPPEHGDAEVRLEGDLVLREHRFPVTWIGSATFDPDGAWVEVVTTFTFDDAALRAPRLGVFITVDEDITVEVRLRLVRR